MAKILVIAKEVSEAAWNFSKALKNQGHQIIILTSKDQNIPWSDTHIQIHFYFKKWNLWESLQYIPYLFKENLEIVHFYIESEGFGMSQVGLLSLLNWDPSILVSTSIMNLKMEIKRFSSMRWLLERSDLVTTSTLEMMAALRGLNIRNTQQTRGLLPPLLDFKTKKISATEAETDWLSSQFLKDHLFLIVPIESHHELTTGYLQELSELTQKFRLLFCFVEKEIPLHQKKKIESQLNHHIGSGWAFVFDSHESKMLALAPLSHGLLLAGQNYKPLEFSKWIRWSFIGQSAPLIDDEQGKMYEALWEDNINCKVFRRYHLQKDYHQWVKSSESSHKIQSAETFSDKKEIVDAPLNQLQRLYNKALSRKSFVS